METPEKSANDCAKPFLKEALGLCQCSKANYHIRMALQMLEFDEIDDVEPEALEELAPD